MLVSQDQTPPDLLLVSSGSDASAVALDAVIELTFPEEIQVGQGVIQLLTAQGDSLEIDVNDSSQVSISGQIMIINPAGLLTAGTTYELIIGSNVVWDRSGNAHVPTEQNSYVFQAVAKSDPQMCHLIHEEMQSQLDALLCRLDVDAIVIESTESIS